MFLLVNRVRDINPIAHLKQLVRLNLSHNQVLDVTPLAELSESLKELDLNRNQVRDVTPLAELTNLKELNLEVNQIVDVTPLAELTNLSKLNLRDNQIIDVIPLAQLINLSELKLRGNPITIKGTYPLSALLDENPKIRIDIEVWREAGGSMITGDINGDGIVNILDLVLVAGRFGQSGQDSADVNGDGIVNILDLVLVAGAFGNAAAASLGSANACNADGCGRGALVGSSANIGFDRCNDPNGCAGARATRGCLDAGGDGIATKLPESVQPGDLDSLPTLGGQSGIGIHL